MKMMQFMLDNLDHLIPIILCAIVAITIIVERLRALYLAYPIHGVDAFFERIRTLVLSDRVGEAVALCERYSHKPLAHVVREGLARAHQPKEIVEHGLEVAVGQAVERVKARTGFLSMIANVATLLGLIGTILGLIQSFEAVGSANAQQRSALLAQGISTAMNHTLFGLGVAVPCMVMFSFLMNRANKLKAQLERGAVIIMDMLKQRHVIVAELQSDAPRGSHAQRRAL